MKVEKSITLIITSDPTGNRTPVSGVRGRCLRLLLNLQQLTLTVKDIAPLFWGFEIGDNNERPKCIDQEPTGWSLHQFR